jgi:hypothetical protein
MFKLFCDSVDNFIDIILEMSSLQVLSLFYQHQHEATHTFIFTGYDHAEFMVPYIKNLGFSRIHVATVKNEDNNVKQMIVDCKDLPLIGRQHTEVARRCDLFQFVSL